MSSSERDRYELVIGGERTAPAEATYTTSYDPATETAIAEVATAAAADVDAAVVAAGEAFSAWGRSGPRERADQLHAFADRMEAATEELARLETRDQGKPIGQSRADITSSVRYLRYYAGAVDKLEGTTVPVGGDQLSYVLREPYGVAAEVTPWNFPANVLLRGVAPALAAGNTTVVKPAIATALSSCRIAELALEAGLPAGVLNVVPGGPETGAALVGHPGVDTITFTGSVATGQKVMEAAAAHITDVTLELGGKNAALVYPDADIAQTARWLVRAAFTNAGQVCSAVGRVLVDASVHDALVAAVTDAAAGLTVGAGIDDPDVGPLVTGLHRERVEAAIATARAAGATVVTGGSPHDGPGHFVEPTVLAEVTPEMAIAREEVFGPVLPILRVAPEDDPVALANDSPYGLVAGVFTHDVTRAHRVAAALEVGTVYINTWWGDTNQTPFGGVKHSGIGRAKGLAALESYLQTKHVAVGLDAGADALPGS
ncbi:MAG: aldehyde dehydrogenase family protein [Haloferacaceae archaeon]|nr:aldehyde dehydrogenase family protein [Haloferacaceae archaeon]